MDGESITTELATKVFEHFMLDFGINRCFKFDLLLYIDIFSMKFRC